MIFTLIELFNLSGVDVGYMWISEWTLLVFVFEWDWSRPKNMLTILGSIVIISGSLTWLFMVYNLENFHSE